MGFLYYIPNAGEKVTAADFAAAGIGYAFDGKPVCRQVLRGPDGTGRPGAVVAVGISPDKVGFYPESQTWRRIPKTETWVGFYADAKPGPAELVRAETLDGHFVRLGDERQWLVPVARAAAETGDQLTGWCALPSRAGMSDDGEWTVGEPVERYAELWGIAGRFWDSIFATDEAEGKIEFGLATLLDDAATALGANYRVGRTECAIIGLLDGHFAQRVLEALVDWPTVAEWLKKKAAAGSDPADSNG